MIYTWRCANCGNEEEVVRPSSESDVQPDVFCCDRVSYVKVLSQVFVAVKTFEPYVHNGNVIGSAAAQEEYFDRNGLADRREYGELETSDSDHGHFSRYDPPPSDRAVEMERMVGYSDETEATSWQ